MPWAIGSSASVPEQKIVPDAAWRSSVRASDRPDAARAIIGAHASCVARVGRRPHRRWSPGGRGGGRRAAGAGRSANADEGRAQAQSRRQAGRGDRAVSRSADARPRLVRRPLRSRHRARSQGRLRGGPAVVHRRRFSSRRTRARSRRSPAWRCPMPSAATSARRRRFTGRCSIARRRPTTSRRRQKPRTRWAASTWRPAISTMRRSGTRRATKRRAGRKTCRARRSISRTCGGRTRRPESRRAAATRRPRTRRWRP